MPLFLLPPPPILSTADLVFAAGKLKWQVEQPFSGLPNLQLRGRDDVFLYGETRAVTTWAHSLGLSLIGPTPGWVEQLPETYRLRRAEKAWDLEIRCFVLQRRVVAWCAFARLGETLDYAGLRATSEAEQQPGIEFANRLLADPLIAVPPAFVLDVGGGADGWSVTAAHPASISAKFYAPPELVLPVLRRATVARKQLKEEDRPWILAPFGGPPE